MIASLTHADLVARAVRWLRNSQRCNPIMTRAAMMVTEQPDAIGWQGTGRSFLLECKTSRADFFRDLRKGHRAISIQFPSKGMGNRRYYLTPISLLTAEEIPEGWGLLEVKGTRLRETKEAIHHPQKNIAEELRLIIAAMRHGCGEIEVAMKGTP